MAVLIRWRGRVRTAIPTVRFLFFVTAALGLCWAASLAVMITPPDTFATHVVFTLHGMTVALLAWFLNMILL